MNNTLQKFLTSALLCCLACISTTTIHATQNDIKNAKQELRSLILNNPNLFKHDKNPQILQKNPERFYTISLTTEPKDNLLYQTIINTICKDKLNPANSTFCLLKNTSKKLFRMQNYMSQHVFNHQIPTKYIEIFYNKKHIKNEKKLERILDKHLKKDPLLNKSLCFTYKILYFPLLFMT